MPITANGQYCWDILLSQQILDAMNRVTDGNFIFQQDSALFTLTEAAKRKYVENIQHCVFDDVDVWANIQVIS